jgi:S1-C subfamily serine protease
VDGEVKPGETTMKRLCLALAATALAAPAPAADFDGAALYERCVKSCVFLVTPRADKHVEGTGTLIDADKRLVLTTLQAVGEAQTTYAQFPIRKKDGSLVMEKKPYLDRIPAGLAIRGKVLHRDKARDLALVQLEKLPPDTPAVPLARESVKVAERVLQIGSPGKGDVVLATTEGTVRAVAVEEWVIPRGEAVDRVKVRAVATTNRVPADDVGGPLLDRHGRVVAVQMPGTPGSATVNRAVDVTEVRAFLTAKKVKVPEPDAKADPKKGGPDK